MILAIDVGNTNIVVGAFDNDKLTFSARMSTDKNKLADEYAIDLKDIFALYGMDRPVTGAIISCVVPQLSDTVRAAIRTAFKTEALVVGPGIKTGMNIRIDKASELGSDIVADAVSAYASYPAPLLIFDMGTATTISVIDEHAEILGVVIFPGVRTSLNARTANAAQLLDVGVEAPPDIIGTNTIDSMKSGIVYGTASMIDGIIERMRERLGRDLTVVATGGHSAKITPYCRNQVIVNPNLLLEGLYKLYKKNS